MGWNESLQQPILQDGIDLKVDIKLLNFDWYQEVEQPTSKTAITMDMDNMSLPSFQMVTKSATLPTLSAPGTTTTSPALVQNSPPTSSNTVASDNLTMDSMIASRLSTLKANWNVILQCLDCIAEMGATSTSSGLGITPSPSTNPPLGSAMAIPGKRE